MSNCGSCRGQICTCVFEDSDTVDVIGTGASRQPIQFRPKAPAYRAFGCIRKEGTQVIPANVGTLLLLDESMVPFTGTDMFNPATPNRLTIPFAGTYLIYGSAGVTAEGGTQLWHLWIALNGVAGSPLVQQTVFSDDSYVSPLFATVMTLDRFNAGDYIELYGLSNLLADTLNSFVFSDAEPVLAAAYLGS